MVLSVVAKVVLGVVTFLSAPMAVPVVTVPTASGAGVVGGATSVVAAGAGGATSGGGASSFFLQAKTATSASVSTDRAMNLRMEPSLLTFGRGITSRARSA